MAGCCGPCCCANSGVSTVDLNGGFATYLSDDANTHGPSIYGLGGLVVYDKESTGVVLNVKVSRVGHDRGLD